LNWLFERPKWQLALLSGILVGLAYPPLPLGFLIWISFLPFIALLLQSTPLQALRFGYLAGITANVISLYWIGFNRGASWGAVLLSLIAAVLYLGLFWALFGSAVSWLHKKTGQGLAMIPFLWVLMEYSRSFGTLAFPWHNLALTQTHYLPLVQIADITGTYGISFWIMLLNVGFYSTLTTTRNRPLLLSLTGVVFFSLLVLGQWRLLTWDKLPVEKTISVAIVQPNVDPNQKWDYAFRNELFELMDSLHVAAIGLEPDFILWPESATPAYLRLSSHARRPIQKRVMKSKIPLLAGTVDRKTRGEGVYDYYNGSLYLKPDGSLQIYHKIHLVPFGEYIPWTKQFPVLKKLNLGQGNFTPGDQYTLFAVDSVQFGNLICYESSMPHISRRFVQKGARFLTVETNDAWFGDTSGPYQHFELARLRAIELRKPIARSANTGISGIILPSGRVPQAIPLNQQGILKGDLPLSNPSSYYARHGNWFVLVDFLVLLLLIGVGWLKPLPR